MRTFELLRGSSLPEDTRPVVARLLELQAELNGRLQGLRDRRINVTRIRHHGDYHLGQVLHTGKDFVIIDFEGDPRRTIGQRRIKACPLRDVATMLRSIDYVAHSALHGQVPGVIARPDAAQSLHGWATFWSRWASALFLAGYLETVGRPSFMPATVDDTRVLLQFYLLERGLVELRHELTERLEWAHTPLHGLLEILEPSPAPAPNP